MKNGIVHGRKLINMEHVRHPLKSLTKITTQNILIHLSQQSSGSKVGKYCSVARKSKCELQLNSN